MAACGSDGGNGITSGSLGTSFEKTYSVSVVDANVIFTHGKDGDGNLFQLSDVLDDYTVTLTPKDSQESTFTLRLGDVKPAALSSNALPPELTVTPDLKVFVIGGFQDGPDEYDNTIRWFKSFDITVFLAYANKDGTATGVTTEGTDTFNFNLALKEGWNTVIQTRTGTSVTVKTGTPGSDFRWEYNW
jgi:hypothetical protein